MTADRNAPAALEGVVALSALLDYQAGTVVSRTLVKKEGGTVTAFAFDGGEGLSEHTTGKLHRVSSGQLLQLPAGQPHAVKAVGRFKMVLIMIRD